MKIKLLLLLVIVSFSQCNSEKKSEQKGEEKQPKDTSAVEVVDETNFKIQVLELSSPYPFLTSFNENSKGKLELTTGGDDKIIVEINFSESLKDQLELNISELIPTISNLAYSNNFHQQLSIYLFEKQWHTSRIDYKSVNESITYYEVLNPPRGEYWFLNAVLEENGDSKIVASYRFKLPESIFAKHFEKLNNRKFVDYKAYLFNAPESQKIEYNSLRKMGKFYEGFAASLNNTDPNYKNYLIGSIFALKNSPKKISYFYDADFDFPEMLENGYDTTHFSKHSLKELFASQTFSYKTTYPVNGGKDSLLETQIDFGSKENTPTLRLVMGGLVFSEIPRIKSDDFTNGLYLPLGFSKYKNETIQQESYILMGNTTGFWLDNTFGRNIDGVTLYFDKNSPYKLHIWLMGGDGTIPVGHYLTSIDQMK
jgi:hypothetical protein